MLMNLGKEKVLKIKDDLIHKIHFLESHIFKNYERYKSKLEYINDDGKSENRLVNISDIASYFEIYLDQSRLDDYKVEDININALTIAIRDTKENIVYKANFSYDSNIEKIEDAFALYDISRPYNSIINTTVVTDNYIKEKSYYVGSKEPIMERVTFIKQKDSYKDMIVVTRTNSKQIDETYLGHACYRNSTQIEYKKAFDCDISMEVILYKRKYEDIIYKNGSVSSLEEIATNAGININSFDKKYFIAYNDSVSYYVSKFNTPDEGNDFCGWCLEQGGMELDRPYIIFNHYNPHTWEQIPYSSCATKDIDASIVFIMHDEYNKETKKMKELVLSISKTKDNINIRYIHIPVELYRYKFLFEDINIGIKDLSIPALKEGRITIKELSRICIILNELDKNPFITRCISEIKEFINIINLRDGNNKKISDIDCSMLSHLAIDDIANKIGSECDKYFDLSEEEKNKVLKLTK